MDPHPYRTPSDPRPPSRTDAAEPSGAVVFAVVLVVLTMLYMFREHHPPDYGGGGAIYLTPSHAGAGARHH